MCQEDSCIVGVELKILPLRPPGDFTTRFVFRLLCCRHVSVQTNNLVAEIIGVPATCLGLRVEILFRDSYCSVQVLPNNLKTQSPLYFFQTRITKNLKTCGWFCIFSLDVINRGVE